MPARVVITGAGVVTPLGETPAELHAALVAGRSALRPVTRFDVTGLRCTLAGELDFDERAALGGERNLRPLDRVSRLTAAAAGRALRDSGWDQARVRDSHVGLVLGTVFCGLQTIAEFDRRGLTRGPAYVSPFDFANTVINAAAGQAAIWHGLTGVSSTVCAGAASGLEAIAQAADLIRAGRARVLLAGGVEELSHEAFVGFARAGASCGSNGGAAPPCPVPFEAHRNGFAPAEAAALLVLEEAESARTRGARILAEVSGAASAYDVSRGRDTGRCAQAVARAVRRALAESALEAGEIEAVSGGANGSPGWDGAEAAGLADVFGASVATLPVTAPKAMLGETLGAAGALQVVDLLEAMREGTLPGVAGLEQLEPGLRLRPQAEARSVAIQRALVSSGGFDGACGALVLARAGRERD